MKDVEFADRFDFRETPAAVRHWPKGWKGPVPDEVAEAAQAEGKLVGPKGDKEVAPVKEPEPTVDDEATLNRRLEGHTVTQLKALYAALNLPADDLPSRKGDIITAILAGADEAAITAMVDAAATASAGGTE